MLLQQMKNRSSGFTLVELIVVITILAILGTIGFVSLSNYTGQSRDSKRLSDIRSIEKVISVRMSDGVSLMNTISGTTAQRLSSTNYIAGSGADLLQAAAFYEAGVPNFTVLGLQIDNFKDPVSGDTYRMWATSRTGNSYQVAAKSESDGTPGLLVSGNWTPRTMTTTLDFTGINNETKWILSNGATGLFFKNDIVTFYSGATILNRATISSIASDGKTIQFSPAISGGTATKIAIGSGTTWNAEPASLIARGGASISTSNLPY